MRIIGDQTPIPQQPIHPGGKCQDRAQHKIQGMNDHQRRDEFDVKRDRETTCKPIKPLLNIFPRKRHDQNAKKNSLTMRSARIPC